MPKNSRSTGAAVTRTRPIGVSRPEERECCHPRCTALPQQLYAFPIPLCTRHIVQVLERSAEVTAQARRDHIVKNSRPLPVTRQAMRNSGDSKFSHDPVVYYIRFGNRVKIGTTTNLRSRLKQLPHDEVLAVEPGGHAVEQVRHKQFATKRVNGEWFELDSGMSAYIDKLRKKVS